MANPEQLAKLKGGLIRILWDFGMWRGDIPTQRNPMELVTVKGATKRTQQPRSLTVEEFQNFVEHLQGPYRVIAMIRVCLRLRWSDVDWLSARLRIERSIVRQRSVTLNHESS